MTGGYFTPRACLPIVPRPCRDVCRLRMSFRVSHQAREVAKALGTTGAPAVDKRVRESVETAYLCKPFSNARHAVAEHAIRTFDFRSARLGRGRARLAQQLSGGVFLGAAAASDLLALLLVPVFPVLVLAIRIAVPSVTAHAPRRRGVHGLGAGRALVDEEKHGVCSCAEGDVGVGRSRAESGGSGPQLVDSRSRGLRRRSGGSERSRSDRRRTAAGRAREPSAQTPRGLVIRPARREVAGRKRVGRVGRVERAASVEGLGRPKLVVLHPF